MSQEQSLPSRLVQGTRSAQLIGIRNLPCVVHSNTKLNEAGIEPDAQLDVCLHHLLGGFAHEPDMDK
jgi:hypothetical protein